MENKKRTVVYVSAEGRGLGRRILAWARYWFPDEQPEQVLRGLSFYCMECPVNFSDLMQRKAFCDEVDQLPESPDLIVIDTLSRNSQDVEESNSQMATFLTDVDRDLRSQYDCTVLLIHHTGHANKDRARGPSSLVANTEASYFMKRVDPENVSFQVDRLKDSEVPKALDLHAVIVETGRLDEEGIPVTSVVLTSTGTNVTSPSKPTGKNQLAGYKTLVEALGDSDELDVTDQELKDLLQRAVDRKRRKEVVEGLQNGGWLTKRGDRWVFTR